MKRFAAALLCLFFSAQIRAENFSGCFIPGEISEYKVSWMGVPLAWSRSTTDVVNHNGTDRIRITMVSRTYTAYDHIYKVDDKTEVILDPESALPIQLDLMLNEGNRKKSHLTTFDHTRGEAVFIDRMAGTTNVVAIAPDTREILSFLYSSRIRDLTVMKEQIHTLFVDGKMHEVGLTLGKTKRLKIPDRGKVESIRIEPLAEFDGLFLRQGKIFFWVSKADRRMVTLVQASVPVGKVNVKLQNVSGPGHDFWVKEQE
ncbi:DUF3108 domain-containing protein [Verrucomicrobia bacterium S94]|nr:DUF3108 domain-containing protein [Verrucomicrobia bacterium S94]